MKLFTLLTLLLGFSAMAAEPLKYQDNIDASGANITSASYSTLVTATKKVNHVMVLNNTAGPLYVCIASASTSCASGTDLHVANGQGFALDDFPMNEKIFVKSVSGTLSSGSVSAIMWWSFN